MRVRPPRYDRWWEEIFLITVRATKAETQAVIQGSHEGCPDPDHAATCNHGANAAMLASASFCCALNSRAR